MHRRYQHLQLFAPLIYKTNIFHVVIGLFSNRSQIDIKMC